jgi:hypothetical protein
MKITHLLAALLLVSSVATQASAHERIHKIAHHALLRGYSMNRAVAQDRTGFLNSYNSSFSGLRDEGPNSPGGVAAGGTMWNGRSASEFGG